MTVFFLPNIFFFMRVVTSNYHELAYKVSI